MDEPILRVVKGNPSDAELAALVVVLTGRARESSRDERLDRWADRSRMFGYHRLVPGVTAWRASGFPGR